jgi:hypothetical protein
MLPSVRQYIAAFISNHKASYSRRHKIISAMRFGFTWSRKGSPIKLQTQERQGEPSLPPPPTTSIWPLHSATLLSATSVSLSECHASTVLRKCDSPTLTAVSVEMCCKRATGYTGLFEMIVGVLTTCHTQYT